MSVAVTSMGGESVDHRARGGHDLGRGAAVLPVEGPDRRVGALRPRGHHVDDGSEVEVHPGVVQRGAEPVGQRGEFGGRQGALLEGRRQRLEPGPCSDWTCPPSWSAATQSPGPGDGGLPPLDRRRELRRRCLRTAGEEDAADPARGQRARRRRGPRAGRRPRTAGRPARGGPSPPAPPRPGPPSWARRRCWSADDEVGRRLARHRPTSRRRARAAGSRAPRDGGRWARPRVCPTTRSALIAAQRMVRRDLHQHDADAVGVRDPHLVQAPRLHAAVAGGPARPRRPGGRARPRGRAPGATARVPAAASSDRPDSSSSPLPRKKTTPGCSGGPNSRYTARPSTSP